MASTNTSATAAKRYAAAFIETAHAAQSIDSVEKDVADLTAMLANSKDFQTFIKSPLVREQAQGAAIAALADKAGFHAVTRNFLFTLVKNRRLATLGDVLVAVRREISRRRGEVEAKVQSAQVLSAEQTRELQDTISRALGSNVTLDVSVDKSLIGGMVVQVGSTIVDASVKSKIERLSRAMMRGNAKAA